MACIRQQALKAGPRVVPCRRGPVSWIIMRFRVRFFASFVAVAALALHAGICAEAQSTAAQSTGIGTYIVVDPLANVRYDNRYDVSVGFGYDHMKAGPTLLQGSNLGGLDLSASYWLTRHWGIEGNGRLYVGTSGAGVNPYDIQGPVVSQTFFTGGPEWLGPHNKHGALTAHALFGGGYGTFKETRPPYPPSAFVFPNTQIAPAAIIGGHMDLNRSEHWGFRITPDAVMTHYSTNYAPK